MTQERKDKLVEAMEVAGYYINWIEMSDEYIPFSYEGGCMYLELDEDHEDVWEQLDDWVSNVCFDDPEIDEKVHDILDN